jgi:hypothetical protein
MKEYIALAPASADIRPKLGEKTMMRKIADAAWSPAYFAPSGLPLAQSDPAYIVREATYQAKSPGNNYPADPTKSAQYAFSAASIAADVRVSYRSAKYPWLESVSAFKNPFLEHEPWAGRSSIARFAVPAFSGPGDYIVWYSWCQ